MQAGGADALKGRKKPIAVPHGVAQLVLVWKLRADRLGGKPRDEEAKTNNNEEARATTDGHRRTEQFSQKPHKNGL